MPQAITIDTPLGRDLTLTRFHGSEHVGCLSEFQVQLKSKRSDIVGEDLLGKRVTIELQMPTGLGSQRYFNGYVTRWCGLTEVVEAVQGQNQSKAYLYDATIHPWLWFLTRRANSRIFQNKSVPGIIKEVFGAHAGLASFQDKLTATYQPRVFCSQYNETDFNFVSRLMEEEGIYYYFTHEKEKHTLVLVDATSHHEPFPHYAKLRFGTKEQLSAEYLDVWTTQYEIQSGKYAISNYNPETPRMKLFATVERKRNHPHADLEVFEFPAEFDKVDDARKVATIRLQERQVQYHRFSGGGQVSGFSPGCVFELERHPVTAYNAKYLVLGATYSGTAGHDSSGGDYDERFISQVHAIAANQQYRPPRTAPKPLISGPQTATVVGPAGEEIYTDDKEHMGSVKVQFHWDRYGASDANSSCWIRVATPWAGKGYGAIAVPRVGDEVVVEFLEGDPDRPLITGSVYNGVNKPPYPLPAEKTRWGLKTRSSKEGGASNFNELSFDDKKGSEEVFLHAEKDHNVLIKNDRKEAVGNESHLDVKKNHLSKFGADVQSDVTGDDVSKVGGSVHLTVGQDWQGKIGTKLAVDAGQEIHLKAGMTIVIEGGMTISLKAGGSFINIGPDGVTIQGAIVKVNSGGSGGSGSGASPKSPLSAKKVEEPKNSAPTPSADAMKEARASGAAVVQIN